MGLIRPIPDSTRIVLALAASSFGHNRSLNINHNLCWRKKSNVKRGCGSEVRAKVTDATAKVVGRRLFRCILDKQFDVAMNASNRGRQLLMYQGSEYSKGPL